jgi:hypothetical protein
VAQARSLTFIQRFQVPLRHRTPHLSGNSAAVESFARSGHGGKDGLAEVLTFLEGGLVRKEDSNKQSKPLFR